MDIQHLWLCAARLTALARELLQCSVVNAQHSQQLAHGVVLALYPLDGSKELVVGRGAGGLVRWESLAELAHFELELSDVRTPSLTAALLILPDALALLGLRVVGLKDHTVARRR